MTLVTPSLVFSKASIASTLTHTLQTSTLTTLQTATSITSVVTRVLPLMTQVCSTAHTFLCRWFVPLVRTPSSLRSDLRPVMVLFPTPSLKEPTKAWVHSTLTRTVTTDVLRLRTSCDIISLRVKEVQGESSDSLFLSKYLEKRWQDHK